MSPSKRHAASAATDTLNDESLKLAVAISLLRSKFLQHHPSPSQTDALKWKRKAKERKQEILRLRDDLKEAEDASQCDLFPQTASCKCYFFDNMGKLSPNRLGDASDRRFNDVLRRRFLRQVRLRERRQTAGSSKKRRALVALKNLLSMGKNLESTEGVVSSLIMRLVRRMSSPSKGDDYLLIWSTNEGFDNILFEEWVTSLLQARKSVEVLESRNGLYVLYMDRVTGELAKLVGQVSSLQKLNSDIFDALLGL